MSKPQPFHSFKLFADEEDFAEIVYEKHVFIQILTIVKCIKKFKY